MGTKLNYAAIGAFVMGLIAAFIIIAFWLAANTSSKSYNTYAVYMQESVSGLSQDAPVKYNGVVVGSVNQIKLNPDNPQEVILLLKIETGTPITEATTATLTTQGITGIAFIELKGGHIGAPPLTAKEDEDYPVIKNSPSLLLRLDIALSDLTSRLINVSAGLNKLLNPENQKAFKESLANIAKLTNSFNTQLPTTVKSFNKFTDEAASTFKTLSEDSLPETTETIAKLRSVSNELLNLSRDLEQNPSMLIRGRASPPPGPGED